MHELGPTLVQQPLDEFSPPDAQLQSSTLPPPHTPVHMRPRTEVPVHRTQGPQAARAMCFGLSHFLDLKMYFFFPFLLHCCHL